MSSLHNRRLGLRPARSVIDAWLSIAGNLMTDGEIIAEGQITGDVRCIRLVIGLDAVVTGTIVADEVIVRGKVKGTIRANRVVLEATAVVDAEIFYRQMRMDRGACFDGAARRRDQPLAADLDRGIAQLKTAAMILRQLDQAREPIVVNPGYARGGSA
jgi:cytoskeletal protein CcmA (bactofilin family)